MDKKFALASIAVFFLGGCAHDYSYPPLFSPTQASAGKDGTYTCGQASNIYSGSNIVAKRMENLIDEAVRFQCQYGVGYLQSARNQDLSQLPIIALAGLAGLVLINDKLDVANDVAKLGLVAGTYSASRGALTAENLPAFYMKGHAAITCVNSYGYRFAGEVGAESYDNFESAVSVHFELIRQLESAIAITPTGLSDDQVKALDSAKKIAALALAQARTSQAGALSELGAFQSAPAIFTNAVAAISVRVASGGRERATVDFGTLRDQFGGVSSTAQISTENRLSELVRAAQALPSRLNEERSAQMDGTKAIDLILKRTENLTTQSTILNASSPQYSTALTNLSKCPESVS